MKEISKSEDIVDQGLSLIAESRLIHGYMKDLVFDLFTPQMYNLVKDLIYAPRYSTTVDFLNQSASRFRNSFNEFMASPRIIGLLHDSELRDEYNTANTMSRKAFARIRELQRSLAALQDAGVLGQSDLYLKMQNDSSLLTFFDSLRSTSYYLDNSFQSFLERFIASLRQEAVRTQERILWVFWLYSAFSGMLTVAVSLLFSGRIAKRLGIVEQNIRAMSQGNFGLRLDIKTKDEFGMLSDKISGFVLDLKHNVDSVLRLMRDVSSAINDRSDIDRLLHVVARSICNDLEADCALVTTADAEEGYRVRAKSGEVPAGVDNRLVQRTFERVFKEGCTVFVGGNGIRSAENGCPDAETEAEQGSAAGASLVALPLEVRGRRFGVIVVMTGESSEPLNDLDLTSLTTFAWYTSVTIDNYQTYHELIERREAEFQALQAQIQPHFLYNVLSGFVGLNRMGDRNGLEHAILALKEMMRYILEHEELSTVKEEFLFLEKYCALQKIRFQDRLEVSLECDPEAEDILLPKLLLQPLVENAIIHGIEPLDGGGRLHVVASTRVGGRGRELEVRISDDGVGFDPVPIDPNEHIGLWNVRQRLSLSHPDATLRVSSSLGTGTRIEISIPLQEHAA